MTKSLHCSKKIATPIVNKQKHNEYMITPHVSNTDSKTENNMKEKIYSIYQLKTQKHQYHVACTVQSKT